MKTLIVALILFYSINLYAGEDLDFGIEVGISTPNDQMNNIYNRDFQPYIKSSGTVNDTLVGNLLRESASVGYHIGIRIKVPIKNWLKLQGSVGYHRFRSSELKITDPTNSKNVLATLFTYQNIVPITAGADLYLINKKFFGYYISGELAFNQFSFTTDVPLTKDQTISVPIQNTGNYNNFGAAVGSGFDINLVAVKLNFDVRYHVLNLINTIDDDKFKNYLSISTAIYF